VTVRKLTQMIDYSWRGTFTNAELNALHAEGFDHKLLDDDWVAQVRQHSLGWVCAPWASSTSPGTGGSTPSFSTPW
jgi:hypothetical protein